MTDLTTQIDAILHGAAFAPITDRAFLRITGPDATRWLNGMVTNNIKDLKPGEGNYNFLLNAQGRIQGDCTIYREPGDGDPTYLLETSTYQLETIHQLLDKFIIMDDVELNPAMTDKLGLLVLGTGALGTLDVGLIWPTPPISISYGSVADPAVSGKEVILSVAPNLYEVWGDASLIAWMSSLGERQVSPEALEAYRILSGTPKYGVDIRNTDTNKDLPQETAQTHALNFNKGCYLGQEIVERIHSRGNVHRIFTPFTLSGELPTLPTPLEANGKSVGELTSAVQIGDTIYALGYARREALDTKATLTYVGGTATPRNLN
ncbi:CAF17-like 4Fe-4S cluster assembly/insertion protein YgfZ [Granulicella paludicola]|uniref:CAF17-like 4Fe-4S cluster assembly/insertion protein YgfZ n=1 Tax=Granulicella paludicola TaxID=474951 RepID=UPI0021E0C3BA|nr:folate-binding protein [Granulicella paludicola]